MLCMDIISSTEIPPPHVYTALPRCFWFSQPDLDKWCDYRYAKMCAFTRETTDKRSAIMMLLWYINRFKVFVNNKIADIEYINGEAKVTRVRSVGQQLDVDFLGKVDDNKTMMKVWLQHPGRRTEYIHV